MISINVFLVLVMIGTVFATTVAATGIFKKTISARGREALSHHSVIHWILPDLVMFGWGLGTLTLLVLIWQSNVRINDVFIVIVWYLSALGMLSLRVLVARVQRNK